MPAFFRCIQRDFSQGHSVHGVERYPSASLCLVFDPAKASLTYAVKEAATLLVSPAVLGFIRRYMLPALSRDGAGAY